MDRECGSAEHCQCGRLCIPGFGLALGIVWALCVFIVGLLAAWFGYGRGFVEILSNVYLGYCASIGGSFIGLIWAFFDALFIGLIFAWLYDVLMTACCKRQCARCKEL